MPEFVADYPIDQVTPAAYNPRHLDDVAFGRLKESLSRFGVVKPVILNANGTIVAGHQRTKALEALGETTVAAMVLDKVASTEDEVQFNLLHNSIETGRSAVSLPTWSEDPGYTWVDWQDIDVDDVGKVRTVARCGDLLAGYGPWGSVVAHPETGQVVANSDYAVACVRRREPLLAYYPDVPDVEPLAAILADEFGVYDATKVVKHSWQQYAIQPMRLHKGRITGRTANSTLYERFVKPAHKDGDRVVDFGAGRMAYYHALKDEGWDIVAYEPFLTKPKEQQSSARGGKREFDLPTIVKHIRSVERSVRAGGLFDVVVVDSVLNAAINADYHDWIAWTSWALCDQGGTAFYSTRNLRTAVRRNASDTAASASPVYLGPDNTHVALRMNQWTTIKYHTDETLHAYLSTLFGQVEVFEKNHGNIKAVCSEPKPQPRANIERALEEEWNVPYPGDYRHGRHTGLVEAVLAALDEQGRLL